MNELEQNFQKLADEYTSQLGRFTEALKRETETYSRDIRNLSRARGIVETRLSSAPGDWIQDSLVSYMIRLKQIARQALRERAGDEEEEDVVKREGDLDNALEQSLANFGEPRQNGLATSIFPPHLKSTFVGAGTVGASVLITALIESLLSAQVERAPLIHLIKGFVPYLLGIIVLGTGATWSWRIFQEENLSTRREMKLQAEGFIDSFREQVARYFNDAAQAAYQATDRYIQHYLEQKTTH